MTAWAVVWATVGAFYVWVGARLFLRGKKMAADLSRAVRGIERLWLVFIYTLASIFLAGGLSNLYLALSVYQK